jgi:hypothetical protein
MAAARRLKLAPTEGEPGGTDAPTPAEPEVVAPTPPPEPMPAPEPEPRPEPQPFACKVAGDTMLPEFREGDVVWFHPTAIPWSGQACYVRMADGSSTFRRVRFAWAPGQPAKVILWSDHVETVEYPAEAIAGIYPAIRIEREVRP